MSTGSPCPTLAPRAAPIKPEQPASVPGIVTHKEWVVPPRPKPGRKPATDTPPTKRKAQNRAAQRAFRERRAARVNELEEKLKEVETESAMQTQDQDLQIKQLTFANSQLVKEVMQYKSRVEALQLEVETLQKLKAEQQITASFLTQVASPAPSLGNDPCGMNCVCTDAVDKVFCNQQSIEPIATAISVPLRLRSENKSNDSPEIPSNQELTDCTRCLKEGAECACIMEAAEAMLYSAPKRPTSPNEHETKRTKTDNYVDLTELETDFTTAYMSKPIHVSSASTGVRMPDPCGFCSDGTPCVCAEMAMNNLMTDSDSGENDTKLPPILSHTPPPIDFTQHRPEKLMPLHPPTASMAVPSRSSGCKPGGCDQCKTDPMSTLFCQSLATRINNGSGPPKGCCGGGCGGKDIEGASGCGGAKKSKNRAGGTYIPASAAYQTLSRHRGFEEAAADLGNLVRPLIIRSADGSCPQIEVSSVRDVLKQLDRRFGTDAA
ncbi:hypothetical protein RUND412_001254 [Rhizina undulata]